MSFALHKFAGLFLAWVGLAGAVSASASDAEHSAEIQRATALFTARQYEQARAIVEPLRRTPFPPLQILFLNAQLARVRGDCTTAIDDFNAMLARDASLARPRIDLGVTLWQCGRGQEAVAQLERTLSSGVPRHVEVDVLRVTQAIRSDIGGISLDMQLVRNSNPAQTTQADRIVIQGREYALSRHSTSRGAYGLMVIADARYPLLDQWRLFSATRLEHVDYPGAEADFSYLGSTIGTKQRFGTHSASFEAGAHIARYQDQRLYHGSVWRIADEWLLSPSLVLGGAFDSKQLHYAEYRHLDGWQFTSALTARYVFAPNLSGQFGVSHVRQTATNPAYAFTGPVYSSAIQYEHSDGWLLGARFDRSKSRYQADDPVFGERRVDQRQTVEFSLGHVNLSRLLGLQASGLTPVLLLGSTRSASTIDLYDYRRNFISLALRKTY